MTFARLSAVYGLSFEDISAMPMSAIIAYVRNIPVILGERRLMASYAALTPYLKGPVKILKDLEKEVYGEQTPVVKSAAVLQVHGIEVKHVK